MKVLAIIPARGGSKGIPGKNLRSLGGKPLLYWPIDTALKSNSIDKIIVSTEDELIKSAARLKGIEVIDRPLYLAADHSRVIDTIKHVIDILEHSGEYYDVIVLLECTSPFKDIRNIEEAIRLINEDIADSATTFRESGVSPGRLWRVSLQGVVPYLDGSEPFLPRQEQPKAYQLTGELYAFKTNMLKENTESASILFGRVMPIITNTMTAIDIDSEEDFELAELLIQKYHLS
jgi:CMP-N-acetylneuraminic acid synthetase